MRKRLTGPDVVALAHLANTGVGGVGPARHLGLVHTLRAMGVGNVTAGSRGDWKLGAIRQVRTGLCVLAVVIRCRAKGVAAITGRNALHVDRGRDELRSLDYAAVLRICSSALRWHRFWFGETRCLYKVVAVAAALELAGHPAYITFGANRTPFLGDGGADTIHAWVESETYDLAPVSGVITNDYLTVSRERLRAPRRFRDWIPGKRQRD
jgi:transglutaminase superfamily protein